MQIEDGAGAGNKAEVDDENMLMINAVTQSEEHHVNQHHKEAYHLVFNSSGIIDNSAFLYIKNTDDKDMIIEGYRLYTECNAVIKIVKDPTVASTVLAIDETPANVNLGAGLEADGTFQTAGSSGAISGVTGGTVMDRKYLCSGCADVLTNFEMDVIVPKNKEIAFFTECCSGCNIAGVIPFYVHD